MVSAHDPLMTLAYAIVSENAGVRCSVKAGPDRSGPWGKR